MSTDLNALGFELARAAGHPGFRDRIKAMGYTGEPMVPAEPGATLQSIIDRIGDAKERCLLAIRDEGAPLGWRFIWWEEERP